MALRARYGPGNRAWSYQRPADDSTNGPPLLPSAFGLAISAEDHTAVPESRNESLTPITTAADAVRAASGAAKSRTRSDAGASSTAAARAARAAKTNAARNARASTGSAPLLPTPAELDAAPRRRSGRVPATTTKARAASPTHTLGPQRTAKRKRSTLIPDASVEPGVESESTLGPSRSGIFPPPVGEDGTTEQDASAPRATRGGGSKRPRVSQKDLESKPPRLEEFDESKRTTFGSTTTAPDPFTALSASDWASAQDQNAQPQPEPAASAENADAPRLRRLPPGVPLHGILTGLYRRYPVSQVGLPKEVLADVPDLDKAVSMPPNTIPNAAPFLNLYAPRRTRGIGADKHGLCPICAEPPSRSGRGKAMMLNMKTSAFNYHMQYVHGLSPKTGLPFSPPIDFRAAPRKTVGAREKATLEEGLCHACSRWIVIEGVKAVDVLVPEIYWWKHASTCHKSRMLDGEGDFYIEDPLFLRIVQWQRDHPTATGRDPARASSANASVAILKKEDAMDIDMSGPSFGLGGRQGAVTPIQRDLEDPDSSPLSSLDGTDTASPVGVRKQSAPLHFPPTARGPFVPQSPSMVRARSADGGLGSATPGGNGILFGGAAQPGGNATHLHSYGLGTPQLTNQALPGTLPGTPQTTASTTPVLTGAVLPGVGGAYGIEVDAEAQSVVDSGVALSPQDQPQGKRAEEDAEGEDEDAEGEDDPTATAENTPVLKQLPVLTPLLAHTSMPAPPVQSTEDDTSGLGPMAGVEQDAIQAQVPVTLHQLPNIEPQEPATEHTSPPPAQISSDTTEAAAVISQPAPAPTSALLGEMAQVSVQPPVPTEAQISTEQTQIPMEAPQSQEPPEVATYSGAEAVQEPLVSAELVGLVNTPTGSTIPAEFPNIQEMDMYATSNTPDGSENPQLVLTEEDLALASSDLVLVDQDLGLTGAEMNLGGTDMSLVGEDIDISGVVLQLPAALDPMVTPADPQAAANSTVGQPTQALGRNSGLGLSSGEGTPNTGGETDMFAFWDVTR